MKCETCCKKLENKEIEHGCVECHLDSGLSEYDFKNNLIIRLRKENAKLTKVNDMLHAICEGMRGVCGIARMINAQRPDVRMTHAFNSYDINKLNDYNKQIDGK